LIFLFLGIGAISEPPEAEELAIEAVEVETQGDSFHFSIHIFLPSRVVFPLGNHTVYVLITTGSVEDNL
jgi:hypothetical protein